MSIKKIRKPIGELEYKKLMNFTRGDNSLKEFNRIRFLRIFSLLYYSGCRLNELSQLTVKKVRQNLIHDIFSKCLSTPVSNEFCGYWQGNKRVAERLGA
jgi:integrase